MDSPVVLLIPCLLLSSIAGTSGNHKLGVGVNYGQLGNNLPSPTESVKLLQSLGASSVKIYDASPQILRALRGSGLRLSVMLPNELINATAADPSAAADWVRTNLTPFYSHNRIRYLLVGNEITSIPNDPQILRSLVPAIRNMRRALKEQGLRRIKVGTSVAMDALESSFPPSNATFRAELVGTVFSPLLRFLNRTKSLFFLDVYPYFAWSSQPDQIRLDYALLEKTNVTVRDAGSGLTYTNLLDQMLDAVYFAMVRLGYSGVRISIAESGWPNGCDLDQIGGNVFNAATYNRNVVRKLVAGEGTPAQPRATFMPSFIFALYNENRKPGPGTERHFGLLYAPSGEGVYQIDLSGRTSAYRRPLPKPNNNEVYKGKLWCVARNRTARNRTAVKGAMAWACQQRNVRCGAIEGRGVCSKVGLRDRASFAFNAYWVAYQGSGGSCYFDGLATQTSTNPSRGSCKFPSVVIR